MQNVISFVLKSPARRKRFDDDSVDRLHHRWTVLILAVFATVVLTYHYIGRPVTCWAPAHFKGGWVKYANNYCWVKNTYHLPYEENIPHDYEYDGSTEILFYQWIPFILLFQALLFYIPCQVWRALNSKSGVDADDILAAAEKFSHAIKGNDREKSLLLISNQIDRFVATPRSKGQYKFSLSRLLSRFTFGCGTNFGNYLVLLYIFVKLLYIANVFLQLFVLNLVLKTNYNIFGIEVIKNIENHRSFVNDTVFPKVSMCNFEIRILGNVQRYTLQCLLPINLYTEKMYVFLWWWMVLVLTLSFVNFFTWTMRALFSQDRLLYVRNHLDMMDKLPNNRERVLSKDFTYNYLKQDGVFLLRMVGHNTNLMTLNDILGAVWDHWRNGRPHSLDQNGDTQSLLDDDKTLPLKRKPSSIMSSPGKLEKPDIPPKPSAIYRPNPSAPPQYSPPKQHIDLDQPDSHGIDTHV